MFDARERSPSALVPGQRFGRYTIIERLGAGGMSVVYAAHDPDLDRRVALKILRPGPIIGGAKVEEYTVRLDRAGNVVDPVRDRLLSEGRALARLSHPNLVAVYEVGAVGDSIFLAMEHVAGPTLAAWLDGPTRPWRDVVAVFVQAGLGLEAAHRAGLVHGDFKPDNVVLEAETGRARVVDFGLARAAGTRPAALFGTPRYMAPEQRAGGAVEARADQFAFAVALYEALYGQHPQDEAGAPDARGSTPARAPATRRGPHRIRRALLRALSLEPADRFPSMAALLARIEPRPAALAGVAVGAAAVAGLIFAFAVRGGAPPVDPCSGGPARLAGAWQAARRAEIERAFAATGRPGAVEAAARAAERFDAFGQAWLTMYRDACLASARGEQSPALLDRRMACLDRGLDQLRGRASLLAGKVDGEVVDRALDVAELEPLDRCADARALLGAAAPPTDPARRADIDEIDAAIDRVILADRAGRVDDAVKAARDAIERARAVDHPPLLARAAQALGEALNHAQRHTDAEAALHEALKAAERAGDDPRAAAVLVLLTSVVGVRQSRFTEGRTLAKLADAAISRAGDAAGSDLAIRLLMAEAGITLREGKPREAEALYRRALDERRETAKEDDLRLGDIHNNLGATLDQQSRHDEARAHTRITLDLRRRLLGEAHPLIGEAYANLAISYHREGRYSDARPAYERSLAILSRIPGYTTASVTEGLGVLESERGNHAAAIRHLEATLAERRERLGVSHPHVASALNFLGGAHLAAGHHAVALQHIREGAVIARRSVGEAHYFYGVALSTLGDALRRSGRPREAIGELTHAVEILRAGVGPTDPRTVLARGILALARLDAGRPGDALSELEDVVARSPSRDARRAVFQFGLARALVAGGRAPRRAIELARAARAELSAPHLRVERDKIDAWLARHRR
jgi:tetratricopeptide (TPR) repeat protein